MGYLALSRSVSPRAHASVSVHCPGGVDRMVGLARDGLYPPGRTATRATRTDPEPRSCSRIGPHQADTVTEDRKD